MLKIRAAKAFGEQKKHYVFIQNVEVSNKQLRATTDLKKCEIVKTLLQDTMKDLKYEILELNEHSEKVEKVTKMFPRNQNIETNIYIVPEKTSRSSPRADKISYKILKRLPKCVNVLI